MKVLYAYRYGIVGGVSTQLLLRQTALADAGIECTLFFSQDNGLRQMIDARARVQFGSDVPLSRLARNVRPDAVVVVDSPELLRPGPGYRLRRTPVYLDVHTTTRTGLAYLRDVRLADLAGLMVPSEYSRSVLRALVPGADAVVVPNILDTSVFQPVQRERAPEESPRHFIWVGKLDNHKNWRLAMVYTRLLLDRFGEIRMTLVGGYTAPEERAVQLFDLAHRLNIVPHLDWLDRVDSSAMATLYQRCAATGGSMVVTSRDESFGMAAAEALLCGCPLIANDLPAFREVLPATPRVQLIDIWQPDQFVAAADNLATMDRGGDRISVVEQLRARYGPDAYVSRFLGVLKGESCQPRTS